MRRSALSATFASEWRKLRLRPAILIMGIILVVSVVLFAYVLPYIQFHYPRLAPSGTPMLSDAYFHPLDFLHTTITVVPSLSILAIITGALAAGSEYSFGTLKTLFIQGPSRTVQFFGSFLTLAYLMLLATLLTFVVGALAAVIFALVDETSLLHWPAWFTILRALAATWLIVTTFAAFGVALAHIFRQAAAAIGIGLTYLILVEGLVVHYLIGVNATLDNLLKLLPSVNTQSLVAAFTPTPLNSQSLLQIVGPQQAVILLLLYLFLFLLLSARLLLRRDII